MEEPPLQPIITLYDTVTDSPVFRSSVFHYDQQLDHLEHWLNNLARHLKLYTEKLNKLNVETVNLCQVAIPTGIDETLIDPNFTGAVMKSFADALQSSLSYKTKLITNLEEILVSPLQQFVKTHLEDFKTFRKEHEKAMEKYESQLSKYSALHKTKEPSSIREEAFRLHEARKEYVSMSGQHVVRILNFRSLLEHCLVEKFSAAMIAHKDFTNDVKIWANLDAALAYWKQWLVDDKATCSYQLHKQQIARKRLEDEYIRLTAPDHKIDTYVPTSIRQNKDAQLADAKWGYLFIKTSRHWTRKWFFIHSGYFGSCQVDKRTVTIDNRIRIADHEIATVETDRRFCFEIGSLVLQAETEESLQDWIKIYNKNKKSSSVKSKSKLELSNNNSSSSFSTIASGNDVPNPSSSLTLSKNFSADQGIVTVCTTPDADISLDKSLSITPLLVWEAARNSSSVKKLPSVSWGIPWSLVPTMVNLTQENDTPLATIPRVIWPPQPIAVDLPDVHIVGYAMNSQNRELRRLFGGVQPQEVVLDVFHCSLRKTPASLDTKDIKTSKSSLNSPGAELYEHELVHQLTQTGLKPPSTYGYAYTGRVFITQDTFWFYSCVLLTCINTVAIRLKDIEQVQVIKDTLLTAEKAPFKSDLVIRISVNGKEPIVLGTLMDDPDSTADKLKFAVANAKEAEPMQVRNVYNKIQSLGRQPHQVVVLDVPSTFQSAMKRSHAATVGEEAKQTMTAAVQRRVSEPPAPTPTTVAEKPRAEKKKVEVVDPDEPPAGIKAPTSPVECGCDDHLERMDAQINLPISAKRCYDLLFSNEQTAPPTSGGVWEEKTAAIIGHDLSVSEWAMMDGKMQRVLKYWMPVSNPIVRMKEAEVVETQILINKEDYVRYTVQISTKTAALPYADAFIPSVRYCITWVSQSECQLTCYLGVRWVKSVFVRAIVTRAALKGMSDSVGVFIPILKNAAEKVKASVQQSKQIEVVDDEKSNHSGLDSVVEENETTEEEKEYDLVEATDVEDSSLKVEQTVTTTSSPLLESNVSSSKITLSPSVSSTSHTLKLETSSNPTQQKDVVRAIQKKNSSVSNATAQKLTTEKPTLVKVVAKTPAMKEHRATSWLDTIKDYIPSFSLMSIGSLVLLLLTMYTTCIWFQSGAKVLDEANTYLRMNTSQPIYIQKTKSNARSVYLRDLDEGFLKNSILPPYARSKSYQLFLSSKSDTAASESLLDQLWYDVEHYRLAVDLDMSRERIAMLRHDMLIIFQALNRVDSQLIENEYTNWLLDARLKCKYKAGQDVVEICANVKTQLDKLF